MRDLVFSNGLMRITITGLTPSAYHQARFWSWDAGQASDSSNWYFGSAIPANQFAAYTATNPPIPSVAGQNTVFHSFHSNNLGGAVFIIGGASTNGIVVNGIELSVPEPTSCIAVMMFLTCGFAWRRHARRAAERSAAATSVSR
jgi:hypothetical protein